MIENNVWYRLIDKRKFKDYPYPSLNTSAHELTHSIVQNPDHVPSYGLMCPGQVRWAPVNPPVDMRKVPARRSYLHSCNIMKLRSGILFDPVEY